jgi:rod shape determining protein RodA
MLKASDYPLFICAGVLLLIGVFMILSTTYSMQVRSGEDPFLYLKKDLFLLLIALIGMAVFMYVDYEHLRAAAIPLFILVVLMLFFVDLRGATLQGAQRWFSIGFISFQPSELAKLVIIIMLAYFLETRIEKISGLLSLVPVGLLIGVPFALVFKQPDLGTSLVIIAITFGMLVWAKTSPSILIALFSPILSIVLFQNIYLWIAYMVILSVVLFSMGMRKIDAVAIIALNIGSALIFPKLWGALKDYQKQRLLAFLNPNVDPRGAGYHALQAKIAIGSGGFFGKGIFHGTQTQLQFIPQQFSDFIFSAVGEELGMIGALLVITLFVVIIWRAIKISMESRTVFGSLLAAGIAVMYFFHILVNIGMTLGMLPVVGIPLPFLSFGGSFLLMNLCALGILQSIAMRRQKLIF